MIRCAVLLLAFVALPAAAEPLAAGATVPAFSLADQHGAAHAVDASTRALLVTRDMKAGDAVKAALGEDGAARLARGGVVYVADVHGMPGLVLRMFAEPAMRKRPYPILLDRDGAHTKDVPITEGQATLLVLEALRVVRIESLPDAAAVGAAIDALAGGSPPATPAP